MNRIKGTAPMTDFYEYLEEIDFKKQFEKIAKKYNNKKVLIYGAGELFEAIRANFDLSCLNIIGISDGKYTNEDKETYFAGYKKYLPNEINALNPDVILVSILAYERAIESIKEKINPKAKLIPFAPRPKNSGIGFLLELYKQKKQKEKEAFFNNLKNEILSGCTRIITTAFLHQKTFAEFRNIYGGENAKSVVLMGAGPTINYFEPIEDAIYVGCNRAFLYDKVKFDYLFAVDKYGINQFTDEFINYDCIKFIGDQNAGEHYQIPQYVSYQKNTRRYKTTTNLLNHEFTLDIDTNCIGNFSTVSLQAMQFILFTNPKKIYIAGVDCTINSQGHFQGKKFDMSFRSQNLESTDNKQKRDWFKLKQFVKTYYPETEIISINPVGLKGYFKDVYTKSYLEAQKNKGENDK